MRYLYILIFSLFSFSVFCQVDSLRVGDESPDDIVEDFVNNLDDESEFEYNDIFESLNYLKKKPVNLNKATINQLNPFIELGVLTQLQAQSILDHREVSGDFLSTYELQAVDGMDIETINRILPYVKMGGDTYDFNVPLLKMLVKGRNEVYIGLHRILEEQKGYTPLEEGSTAQRYLGDPNRFYARFRHTYENRLSYGFTMEKDAGEEFFEGSNSQGFDFYSAHFFMKDINSWLKEFALGDYQLNMGQGLIHYNGFSGNKSAFVMGMKRSSRAIKPHKSLSEILFLRGGAVTLTPAKFLEVTLFGSSRKLDGNAQFADTLDTEVAQVSSINFSGLHRTPNEVEDEGAVTETIAGAMVKYKYKNGHIGLNGRYQQYDAPLVKNNDPYNIFFPDSLNPVHASLDYSHIFQNFNFFGEFATDDRGNFASVNGVLMGLDRMVDVSLVHRHYERGYVSSYSAAFAETSQGSNETGLFLGVDVKPSYNWQFTFYADTWRHPWLRFTVDAPSRGSEYLARLSYKRKRDMIVYLQYRNELKEHNAPGNETKADYTVNRSRQQFRVFVEKRVTKRIKLRNRFEMALYDNGVDPEMSKGYMILQDVIFQPLLFPLHFTTRFALFKTDNYDSRIYAYENDILLNFSIPAYYNHGTRFYINLRYRGIRNMVAELRYEQTHYFNRETFGSSLDEIDGPSRSRIKAQIKYQF